MLSAPTSSFQHLFVGGARYESPPPVLRDTTRGMAEITRRRQGEMIRAVFEVVADHPEGLPATTRGSGGLRMSCVSIRLVAWSSWLYCLRKNPQFLRCDDTRLFSGCH